MLLLKKGERPMVFGKNEGSERETCDNGKASTYREAESFRWGVTLSIWVRRGQGRANIPLAKERDRKRALKNVFAPQQPERRFGEKLEALSNRRERRSSLTTRKACERSGLGRRKIRLRRRVAVITLEEAEGRCPGLAR